MKWTKFSFETTTEAVDFVSSMLNDIGIEGIEIQDNVPLSEADKKQMFVDILPILEEDDGTATVNFYIDPNEDINEVLSKVKEGLNELSQFVNVGNSEITVSETQDLDWVNNWKQYFKPFRVDETIVIKPTWETLEDRKENDLVIEIDPGTAFGTGSHETTKLCILGLKKYMKPDDSLMDAGTGSGILAIIAKKLGAKEVLGVDIDFHATDAAIENAEVNHLVMKEGDLSFITGNIIEDGGVRQRIGKEKYDIVVANILADVIIPLSDVIGENLKSGGIFISSGIINTKEEAVKEALLKNNFIIEEIGHMGDWVSFVAKKKSS